jgi:type IV pilus biogenesis/stability protein PilW
MSEGFFVRVTLATFFLVLLGGCAGMSVDRQKEADYHYSLGGAAMGEGDLQRAYVEFQKGLQLDPHHKHILNSLGLVYLQFGEYGKAREYFQKAIAEDPEFSDAYNNLGVTYTKSGEWQKAIESFKNALRNPVYKTAERAYYNIGMAYYRLNDLDASIEALRDSAKRSPIFPAPYYGLALVYNKSGRYGEASQALAKAIEIDPLYKGNKAKFAEEMRQKANAAEGEEKRDLSSYLEILHY